MNKAMKTTKIDADSLEKLRMLAERESRSAPMQLAVLINHAFRTSPQSLPDQAFVTDMMDTLVENAETGVQSKEAKERVSRQRERGLISWGSSGGKVFGTLADGTRVDASGNILA